MKRLLTVTDLTPLLAVTDLGSSPPPRPRQRRTTREISPQRLGLLLDACRQSQTPDRERDASAA